MRWRCICIYQRLTRTSWALRLIHYRCPQHGGADHWKAA